MMNAIVNEKKFEVYYFRGERRASSKCLIYFHCPSVKKKRSQNANLWDEKTIALLSFRLENNKPQISFRYKVVKVSLKGV
jgi:hypothetical protein